MRMIIDDFGTTIEGTDSKEFAPARHVNPPKQVVADSEQQSHDTQLVSD